MAPLGYIEVLDSKGNVLERRPIDSTQYDGWISRSPKVGHAPWASPRSKIW